MSHPLQTWQQCKTEIESFIVEDLSNMSTEPTNAPVTDKHRELSRKLRHTCNPDSENYLSAQDGAQLIANFERDAVAPVMEDLRKQTLANSCLTAELVADKSRADRWEASANHHRDLGITLLDAKYLDPACHTGCQSLVHKSERDAIAAQVAVLREALEKCRNFLDKSASWRKLHGERYDVERDLACDASEALAFTPESASAELSALRQWKKEHMLVESWWQKVDEAVRKRSDVLVGDSVAAKALELIKEVDALREDKARLDWIQVAPVVRLTQLHVQTTPGGDVRAAIDAARKP